MLCANHLEPSFSSGWFAQTSWMIRTIVRNRFARIIWKAFHTRGGRGSSGRGCLIGSQESLSVKSGQCSPCHSRVTFAPCASAPSCWIWSCHPANRDNLPPILVRGYLYNNLHWRFTFEIQPFLSVTFVHSIQTTKDIVKLLCRPVASSF